MRRGGRLPLLIGLVIAAIGGFALYFLFANNQVPAVPGGQSVVPTQALPSVRAVIAKPAIKNNTVISDTSLLDYEDVPAETYNGNTAAYLTDIELVRNKVTLVDIAPGQFVRKDMLGEPGLSQQIPGAAADQPRPKAYPLVVDLQTGVGDQITQGDFIDVVMTFKVKRTVLRPSLAPPATGDGTQPATGLPVITYTQAEVEELSTKTLVQNVQVLRIVKPEVASDTTPTAGGAAPATDANGQPVSQGGPNLLPGQRLLIIAMTDQQAEILKFAQDKARTDQAYYSLVLRGRGDAAIEQTLGTSIDLLIAQFGLPNPERLRLDVVPLAELTPLPTRTPVP